MPIDPEGRRELRKMAFLHGGWLVLLAIGSFIYVWLRLG